MVNKRNVKKCAVTAVFVVALLCATAAAGTIYVDADAAGGDGTSWGTAYKYLQDALHKPPSYGEQIWVAEGTYMSDANSLIPDGSGDREATFQLINGVAIYGGFAGDETSLDERDWKTNETILSGDLNGDDGPDFANNGENSYHVVTGSGIDATAILDGFTITAGNANGSDPHDDGGGMYNDNSSSPTVTNCTFTGNSALVGGGMFNWAGGPTVTNCMFIDNSADVAGGGMLSYVGGLIMTNCTFSGNSAGVGGGMRNYNSSPTVTNCTFSGNEGGNYGGGMFNTNSSPTVMNCTFSENWAHHGGGMSNGSSTPMITNCIFNGNSADNGAGMFNNDSDPNVTNCTFTGNSSDSYGGGMYNENASSAIPTSCTFSANSADYGGGMFNKGSSPTVTNCTFSGNSADTDGGGIYNWEHGSPTVTNCIFTGNLASRYGGGVDIDSGSPTLTNCTVSGNEAYLGGGIFNKGVILTVTNCILWDNTSPTGPQIWDDGILTVTYTDVQGCGGSGAGWDPNCGTDGGDNIDDDPLFIGPNGLDGIPGTADDEEDNVHLRGYSPCINAGDPGGSYSGQVDIDNQPRVAYGRVDMGADEVFPVVGDSEPDEDVDLADFAIFVLNWLLGVE